MQAPKKKHDSLFAIEFMIEWGGDEFTRRETLNFVPQPGLIIIDESFEMIVVSVAFLLENQIWSVCCDVNALIAASMSDKWIQE